MMVEVRTPDAYRMVKVLGPVKGHVLRYAVRCDSCGGCAGTRTKAAALAMAKAHVCQEEVQ